MTSVITKQRDQIQTLKAMIERLEKDVQRYKADLKIKQNEQKLNLCDNCHAQIQNEIDLDDYMALHDESERYNQNTTSQQNTQAGISNDFNSVKTH